MVEPPSDDPYAEPHSALFEGWARLVLRFRWIFVLLSVLALGGSAALIATRLTVDMSVEAFAATASDAHAILEEYRDTFGRDDLYLVMAEGDVFSLEYLRRLEALHHELARLDVPLSGATKARSEASAPAARRPASAKGADDGFGDTGDGFGDGGDGFGDEGDGFGDATDDDWEGEAGGSVVEQITSLINARRTRAVPDGIEVGKLMVPLPTAAELPALEAEVMADPFLVGQVIGASGRHSVVVLRTASLGEDDSTRIHEALVAIAQRHTQPGFKVSTSGLPALTEGLNALMMTDLTRMLGLSVFAMLLILSILFRHPIGVIAPMSVVGISALNTFAFMAITGLPVTMLSNILPAFLFCVGIGDSVHLISVYRDARKFGVDNHAAIVHAVGSTGTPVFYTSLTTMVGLLSFQFATLDAIQDMGLAGAFGVMMAFMHTTVLLPVMLSFNHKSLLGARSGRGHDFIDRFLVICRTLSGDDLDRGFGPTPPVMRRRRRNTLLVGAMLVGVAVFATSLLRVWHNPLSWMPPGTEAKTVFMDVDANIGGTANVQLLIDGSPEKGMKDRALLLGLEKLEAHIKTYADPVVGPIVGNAFSLLDVIKESHQALHGGGRAEWRIPDTDRGVSDMLFLFSNAGPDELAQLATLDMARSQMTIRIKWLEATSYAGLVKHIQEGIDAYIPKNARVRATGSVYTLVNTIRSLIGDLIRSFGVAFLVISLIMIVLLRSLKLGLIAMVPNLMPIAFIMGIMGASGIPIDMNNLLIASISIGVAVDDTIHFLHHFRLQHQRDGNVEHAILMSMQHSGRAMVSTTIILMVGFFTYLGATMYNIQRFGLLVGLTALMALLIDLVFTPALLRLFYARPEVAP